MQVQVSQYLDLRHLGMHICCVLNCKYHMYVDVNQRFCKQLARFRLNKHPQQEYVTLCNSHSSWKCLSRSLSKNTLYVIQTSEMCSTWEICATER